MVAVSSELLGIHKDLNVVCRWTYNWYTVYGLCSMLDFFTAISHLVRSFAKLKQPVIVLICPLGLTPIQKNPLMDQSYETRHALLAQWLPRWSMGGWVDVLLSCYITHILLRDRFTDWCHFLSEFTDRIQNILFRKVLQTIPFQIQRNRPKFSTSPCSFLTSLTIPHLVCVVISVGLSLLDG